MSYLCDRLNTLTVVEPSADKMISTPPQLTPKYSKHPTSQIQEKLYWYKALEQPTGGDSMDLAPGIKLHSGYFSEGEGGNGIGGLVGKHHRDLQHISIQKHRRDDWLREVTSENFL